MILRNAFIVILIVALFAGCAVQNKQVNVSEIPPQKIYNIYKKIETKPSDLHDLYVSYYLDSEINQVLNLMHLGLYAYQKEYYADAEQVLDKVLLNIESIYGQDKHSEDAKSLWYGEDSKRFIGEPYERALAYYYRGLLYLKNNDYENARASFKSGWLQDARSRDEQFQSDFNIFLILDALSSKLNGDENLFLSSLEEMKRHEKFTESVTLSHQLATHESILSFEEAETNDLNDTSKSNEKTNLFESTDNSFIVTYNSLAGRESPELNARVVKVYDKDEIVKVSEDNGNWSKIADSWVENKHLKRLENGNNIEATPLNKGISRLDVIEIYKNEVSSYDREKIKLKDGSTIYYNSTYGVTGWEDYGLIGISKNTKKAQKLNSNSSYKFTKPISSKKDIFVKKEKEELYKSKIFKVKTKNLNIRELPNTTSKIVAKLNQNDLVKSINETRNWIQTDQGWLFKKLLAKKELEENEFFYNGQIQRKLSYKNLIEGISNANFFLVIDTGNAPTKYTDGDYDSELKFSRGSYFSQPAVTINNHETKAQIIDDIHFQATTRGGREIDKIIDGKVAWKDEAAKNAVEFKNASKSSFAAATSIAGNWERTGTEADAIVGGVVLLFTAIATTAAVVGEISESASEAVVTKADARHWKNIPGGIYLYMDKLEPGSYNINLKGISNKNLKVTIPKNGIVVEHVFDQNINKPSSLISNYQLENIIKEEDKYLEKYTEQMKKEKNNENTKNIFSGFFSDSKPKL